MENYNASGKQRCKFYFILFLLFAYVPCIVAQEEPNIPNERIELDSLRVSSSVDIKSFKIDTAFSKKLYKENFKLIPSKVNIYDLPYSVSGNYPNYKRLGLNTAVLYGAGIVALGVLQALPEDATAWNKKDLMNTPLFDRWWNHVKQGPVFDKDNPIFNYLLHPYAGAAYYMGARSIGFNLFYSFLYTASISTFFWEYGIEAFMEIPSIQDLIITPTAGVIVGEGFYLLKRHIVSNGYRLFGSQILGNIVAYVIDPVNEVIGIFAGNPNRKKLKERQISLSCVPWFNSTTRTGNTFGFTANISF